MNLKELLGEELYNQVTAALKGKGEGGKDVELAIANDGSYFPKAKYDELNEKYKAADKLAKDTQKALDDLKAAGDPTELKTQLEKAQQDAKKQADEYKAAMADLELTYALRGALTDAHDPDIVAGLVDKKQLKLQDGKLSGLDEQLKALKEQKAFLFKQPEGNQQHTFKGINPAEGSKGNAGTVFTLEQIQKMTPEEINANWDAVSRSMQKI